MNTEDVGFSPKIYTGINLGPQRCSKPFGFATGMIEATTAVLGTSNVYQRKYKE